MMMKSLHCVKKNTLLRMLYLSAEDGQVDDSYNISPSNLFHAIKSVIKASSSSNSSTQKITNDTVKNLKEVNVDLQKFIPKKTVQKTLDDILNKQLSFLNNFIINLAII